MNWKKKKPGGHVHVACKFKMQHTQTILEQKKKINKKGKAKKKRINHELDIELKKGETLRTCSLQI